MMTWLKNMITRFGRNERGILSVEMVILMPILMIWLVGSNAFFDAFVTYLRASKATYTAVDLISRQNIIGPNYMKNVGSIFASIVDADGAAPSMVISSIKMDDNRLELDWSLNGRGGTGLTSTDQIPTKYVPNLKNGEYVILIQTGVPFVPTYSWGNLVAKTFTNTVAVTPRFDVRVALDPNL